MDGYNLELRDVSRDADDIFIQFVDQTGQQRAAIDVTLHGFQNHLINPEVVAHILEEAREVAERGERAITLRYDQVH